MAPAIAVYPASVDALANDGAGEPLDPASLQLHGTSAPGEALTVPGEGTWTIDTGSGQLTFAPFWHLHRHPVTGRVHGGRHRRQPLEPGNGEP